MTGLTEIEKAQRILEGRCVECGELSPRHLFSCSNLADYRYMYGNYDQYEITDTDHDYHEPN